VIDRASDGGRPWAAFLSRAAALKALTTLALFGAFAVVMSGTGAAPLEDAELIGASSNVAAYRIFAALDTLVWLGFGAVLVGFAALVGGTAPVRAACLAVLAATMVVGMVGGYLRLTAATLLATQYAAVAPDEQASMLQTGRGLAAIIGAHFGLGQVLYGIAFLLIASRTVSMSTFPRYLTYLVGVLGTYSLANQLSVVFLGTFLWAPLFFVFLILTVVMDIAVAATFWRRTSLGDEAGPSSPSP
jgi:hypothetical protein